MLNCVMLDMALIHSTNDRVAKESHYEAMEVTLHRQMSIYEADLGEVLVLICALAMFLYR